MQKLCNRKTDFNSRKRVVLEEKKMKKIVKIFVLFSLLILFWTNCLEATQENIVENEVVEEKIEKKQEKNKPTETKKNETMYVQERCNIRSSYSVDSSRVGGLDVGTEVTVIAEYSNGWYKIKYDGGEAYIKAGILRSTKPQIPEPEQEEEPMEEEETQNTQTPEPPVINDSQNQTDELLDEIGVLPEVGKNIADGLYIAVVILAMIGAIGYRKIRK